MRVWGSGSMCCVATGAVWAQTEPEPPRLDTVVITRQAPSFQPQAGKTEISGAELRMVPGSGGDPMKGLQALPGVTSTSDANGEPAIRGSGPKDNTYTVDGLPVGYLFHVGGLVSVLPVDLVRSFELYSAAWAPQFGNAIGAALDVNLRKPRTDRLGGTLNASFFGVDGVVEGPVGEDQSFYVAARRSYIDLLLKSVEDKKSGVTLTLPRYADYQAKYLWRLNADQRVSLHVNGAGDELSFKLAGDSNLGTQQPVLVGTSEIQTAYGTQALVWDAAFSADARNQLALGHTLNHQSTRIAAAGQVGVAVDNVFVRETMDLQPSEHHELTLGATLDLTRIDVNLDINAARCTSFDPNCDLTSAPRQQVSEVVHARGWALHAQDRWQLDRDWSLALGARHSGEDYLHTRYTEPRLGLDWRWSSRTTLHAGWGLHHQMPPGDQIVVGLGNPNLSQIRARHSVLGLAQKGAGGWSWSAEAYHKQFDDFVVADPLRNYINGARGTARGLEVLLKKDPAGSAFSGWMALSLSHSERHNDVTGALFPFEFDQLVVATVVGTYKPEDRWQWGGKWTYHTGSPITPIVGAGTFPDGRARPIYGPINSERLPPYHRLDLRVDRIVSARLKFFLESINTYGRQNLSGYNYSADYQTREPVNQLPRLISFGVNFSW
ncbi:TonB-dependent receptor plug domain-containing protein [Leptothrix ochracea]|uniref:TonB-dependent receptor plug domain-containing protein n=1 Tax=Leptothrix ochracea TaxID=735331 RepID=UPI0034E2A04A